jgi:hypothetical protein
MPADSPEFLFVDESGDPGPEGDPTYILACIHVDLNTLSAVQAHLVNFRYHHGVKGELKSWGGLLKKHPTQITRSLLRFLLEITGPDGVRASANWLDKQTYIQNGGPHLNRATPTHWFQNYQLRRLLGRHQARHHWGDNTDLVLDRWSMTANHETNLNNYLKGKCGFSPPPHHVTVTDSAYVPLIDLVDMYTKLVRVVAREGEDADPEYIAFGESLMSIKQITGGLY